MSELGGEPCATHRVERSRRDLETRADVEQLVRDFYRHVATDDLLGPVFAAAHVDWPGHIATLTDFWAWQLLGDRGYDGNPLRAHEPVHRRTPFTADHYERWLDLFESTVEEHFAGPQADLAVQRARRMARALRRVLDGHSAPVPPSRKGPNPPGLPLPVARMPIPRVSPLRDDHTGNGMVPSR